MPNVVSTTLTVSAPESILTEIAAKFTAATEEYKEGAFGEYYLMFATLDPDYQWDTEAPRWLGMNHPQPKIKEGHLTISGETRWVMPYQLCKWLATCYNVRVDFRSCEEHVRQTNGWYTPEGDCWIQDDYLEDMREPVREYFVRDGVDCVPDDDNGMPRRRNPHILTPAQQQRFDALVSPELLAMLPSAELTWFKGEIQGLQIQARLYGNYESNRGANTRRLGEWEALHRGDKEAAERRLKAWENVPDLEYFIIGKIEEPVAPGGTPYCTILAVRQWCSSYHSIAELVRLCPDDLVNAYPTVIRDESWTPQTVGELTQDWLSKGRPGTVDVHRDIRELDEEARYNALVSAELLAALPEPARVPASWYLGEVSELTIQARLFGNYPPPDDDPPARKHADVEYYLVGKVYRDILAVRHHDDYGGPPILMRLRPNEIVAADPPLSRDESWTPRTVGELMQEWLSQGYFDRQSPDPSYVPGTVSVHKDLQPWQPKPEQVHRHGEPLDEEEFLKELNEMVLAPGEEWLEELKDVAEEEQGS